MELIIPSEQYYWSYIEAIGEYRRNHVSSYLFLDFPQDELYRMLEDFRRGRNLPEGCVKSTYLWLVRDGEFIGEVSVRHNLTEALLRCGGHIGYGVRYAHWNRGIGTILLADALIYAKEEIGLKKVLVTCADNNIASARVIEKNGGKLQDTIHHVVGGVERMTRRYWIALG